ncbi:tetratricopeptide (TPR) repeat protein [Anaerosolibacter carboniphilus]|uniref:Tetratricopeptide (TPR) repeat protein n=1 Tax=Anaerosolibacter carboniphilus TaxID=1417629 RepID=A0A841KYD3_9FIRM|nr:tetratricopeptide repeat protein [Anaerosolibacter carboniphilus]MBB6218634.1 tetratricopeptide (TPR) repeat protein [Anaerosolibacter carboniphilus]
MLFLEDVILPPGEKIRRIRGFLGAKQEDITGNKITRNLISYVENGKTRLVRDTAQIVVENLLRIAEEQKNPIHLTVDYIMEREEEQADRILKKLAQQMQQYLSTKEKGFMETLNKAEEIIEEWNIPDRKAWIYELVGDFHYEKGDYNESYIYCIKSLESYIQTNFHIKVAEAYCKLGKTSIMLKKYQEAINLNRHCKVILESHGVHDATIIKKIFFNNALAYWNLKLYDPCLEMLEKLIAGYDDLTEKQLFDIYIIKGNCYLHMEEVVLGRQFYEKALEFAEKIGDEELEARAYLKLGETYEKQGDLKKAFECDDESLKRCEKIGSRNLKTTLLVMGKRNIRAHKYSEAKELLSRGIEEAKKRKDYPVLVEIYEQLLLVYTYLHQDEALDKLIHEMNQNQEIQSDNKLPQIYFTASYYFIDKNLEKSKQLLELGLQKILI